MSVQTKLDELSEYSEQVQEVLSKPPSSLLTNGMLVLSGVFFSFVLASCIIRYPDMIQGSVVLTTKSPPVKVHSQAAGRLVRLLKHDSAPVHANTPIAEIENALHSENVPVLTSVLAAVEQSLAGPGTVHFPSDTLTFGDLQGEYNTLKISYLEYKRLLADTYVQDQINLLHHQVTDYAGLSSIIQKQASLNNKVLSNEAFRLATNKRLFEEKVIPEMDMRKIENEYIQTEKEQNSYQKALLETSLVLADKRSQLIELQYQRTQKTRQYQDLIQKSIQNIRNQLSVWKISFLISSPISGELKYLKSLSVNQSVGLNDTLFTIIPANDSLVAISLVSVHNMGKLKKGQTVLIKLDDYPYQEYGFLKGRVKQIAPTPNLGTYRVIVDLSGGLKTSFNKTLPFKPEMTGEAEIVTEDLRLAERLFYQLRKAFSRS